MRIAFALFVAVHGLIHVMGFAKGVGLAEIPALQSPVSTRAAWAWLGAAVLLMAAAAAFLWAPRWWWAPAVAGVVLSQFLILGAWSDARFGTVANVLILLPLLLAAADLRPGSLHSRYQRDVAEALSAAAMGTGVEARAPVTEEDLAGLPGPVRRWLARVGVVGRPPVRWVRIRFHGEIRSGPDEGWMRGPVEQYDFFHPPARYFFMRASRMGVPAHVYHRYAGDAATMEVRLAGVLPLVEVDGDEMTRAETVTILNDLFLFAPGAVPAVPLSWEELDDGGVRVTLENAGHRVSADLTFDQAGDLTGFVSLDRSRQEGGVLRAVPWSTPVLAFGEMGGIRLPVGAEARWLDPAGAWAYARLTLREVTYDEAAADGR